jgi:hypothetical protein
MRMSRCVNPERHPAKGKSPATPGPERKRLPLVRNNASAGRPDGTGALAPSRREMLAVEASLAEARRIWQGDRRGRKTRAFQERSACILPKKTERTSDQGREQSTCVAETRWRKAGVERHGEVAFRPGRKKSLIVSRKPVLHRDAPAAQGFGRGRRVSTTFRALGI